MKKKGEKGEEKGEKGEWMRREMRMFRQSEWIKLKLN